MPSPSTFGHFLMAPVSSIVLFSDAYQASEGRDQHALPVLRTVQAVGQMYFFLACVGSRDDASSPSQVLVLGALQHVVHLKLDDGTELRRLYMLRVPLHGTEELESQRIFTVMRRKVAAPDGVTHMIFFGSGQTETVPFGREQYLDASVGIDEFEDALDLPLPSFNEDGQQL